jgi:hypothetical protein
MFVYAQVRTICSGEKAEGAAATANLPTVNWNPAKPGEVKAPAATIVMFVAMAALFLLTWLTFKIVAGLPG